MLQKLKMLPVAVLASGAIAFGCGGADGAEEANTEVISKAQFVKKANAYCRQDRKEVTQQYTAYGKGLGGDATSEELDEGVARDILMPALEARLAAIRALGVPRGAEAQSASYLSAMQSAVDSLNESSELSFLAFEKAVLPANELGRELGLEDCG